MYLCIYIATHLHTVYLDWLQAVLERSRDPPENDDRVNSEIHTKALIKGVWRSTWRPWSSRFGDASGGRAQVNSEMHLVAMIEHVSRCNWRLRLSELRDKLGGHDWASLDRHLEAVIERVRRYTWRLRLSAFGGALGGCDGESLQIHLQAMIEREWRSTLAGGRSGGGRWEARQLLRPYSPIS